MQGFFFRFREFSTKSLTLGSWPQNMYPIKLTDEQKRQRVNVARDLLRRVEPDGPKRVTDVTTGDETFVPF